MATKQKTKVMCGDKKKDKEVTFEHDKGKITKGIDKCPVCGVKTTNTHAFLTQLKTGATYTMD